MKQQEVFNRIGGIIKELNDQYKYIEENPADLNELELELFIANAHFLANHAEILAKLNSKPKVDKQPEPKKISNEEKYFEPVVQLLDDERPETQINLADTIAEEEPAVIMDEPEVIRHELVIDENDLYDEGEEDEKFTEPEKSNKPIAPKLAAMPKEVVKPAIKKDADNNTEVLTINQKMLAQLGDKGGITEHISVQAIADLKQAITLNDKLLFIKDLFNGYSLAYSEAIEILNRFNTFEEAERFLNKNYTAKNDWAGKPDTTEKFYTLLKRRYS